MSQASDLHMLLFKTAKRIQAAGEAADRSNEADRELMTGARAAIDASRALLRRLEARQHEAEILSVDRQRQADQQIGDSLHPEWLR